ncbi:hypothetical protein A9X02_10695 [Mycobacterium malmoense]|nr:hypothetical protein A9X02_10695 [Mycobacterium malmoense]
MFYFFVNGERSRASAAAFTDEAGSLRWAGVGEVDEVLAYVGMPVQVVDDVGAATFRLGSGLQLRMEVRMPLQVRVDGCTHVLIALGSGVGRWQCDRRRGDGGE